VLREGMSQIRRPPFELALGERGKFGGGSHVRVVWLGVSIGAAPLAELAGEVEARCRAAGLPPEDRPFKAHLTLARSGGRSGGAPLPDLPPPPALGPWEVMEFVLYESRLGRGPAVYAPIERFALNP
jgi:RNA 2',3'-cyclic 3'-phosphodiesterase